MDRTDVHQQIRELSDKINHLNENLFNSRKIHPVEIDLIKLYVRELTAMVDQLAVLSGVAPKVEFGGRKSDVVKEKLAGDIQQPPVAEKVVAPPVVQKENTEPAPPAPKVESGFSIHISENEPAAEEPKVMDEPVAEAQKIEFFAEEPNTSPPPRRQVTIQPPQPGQTERQAPPQQPPVFTQQPPVFTKQEPIQEQKERIKPVIQLSMEEEHTEAPSINDLFAQQDKSEHYSKAKRTDTSGFKESMDLGEKFLFLKELFEGDQAAFDSATEKLSNMNSLEEAKMYVEENLRTQFVWTGKDNVIKQFYTLLEHRFNK